MQAGAGAGAGNGGVTPDTTKWVGVQYVVASLFGEWIGPGKGVVWTTGFVSVATGESWHGRAGLDHLEARFGAAMDADLYFAIGVMREGAKGRSNNEVVAQPLLIVDDIGTKIDRAHWDVLFSLGCPLPTAQIETSPGNETWVWALDGDAADPRRWTDLALIRAWLVDRRLTDEVMDPARYVRLPCGWNSKPKYRGPNGDGMPPTVKLTAWRMGPGGSGRVDLDALARAIVGDRAAWGTGPNGDWRDAGFPNTASGRALMTSAQVGAALGAGALVRTADMSKPDALMRMAVELGMNPEQIRPGVVEALCPNVGAHGARAETGFAFLGNGLMHCNHASCQGLGTADFRAMMIEAMDAKEGRAGAGAEWLAREQVRDAGGLGGPAETAAVVAQAGAMAAAAGARAQAAAVAVAQGLDALVERFAWINSLASFYDTKFRRLVPDALIDTHPDVIGVVPSGKSGEKRARNKLLNHAGMRFLDGVVRESGDDRAVVRVQNSVGEPVDMANIWVPSAYVSGWRQGLRVRRVPSEWLELLGHVVPDVGFRDWLVQWLAWKVQRPRERLMTVPLVVGGQGIGKDALLGPIKEILGRHNVASLTMNQIGGGFTEWMLADLVVLPELKLSADGRMYNQIKDYLGNAEEWVAINEKFQRPYLTRVSFSLISMTNHLNALAGLEVDDRRFQCYVSPAKPQDQAWYARVVGGAMTAQAVAGLLDYLMAVDLTGFSPYSAAPGSKGVKRVMLAENLKGAAQWVYQSVQQGGHFEGRTLLTLAEVEAAANATQSRRVAWSADTHTVRDGLKAAGWTTVNDNIQVQGTQGKYRLWAAPAVQPGLGALRPGQIARDYEEEKVAFETKLLGGIGPNP